MSVVNIVCGADATHMYTDGGLFSKDGSVSAILCKADCLPHLNTVLSSRGSLFFANQLALTINHTFFSYEGLITGLPQLFRQQYERHRDTIEKAGASFELWLAGWSPELGRPEAWAISSHGLCAVRHRAGHRGVSGGLVEIA